MYCIVVNIYGLCDINDGEFVEILVRFLWSVFLYVLLVFERMCIFWWV